MLDCFTTTTPSDCVPVRPVTESTLAAQLKDRPARERRWVEARGFDATPGSWCVVPDPDGGVAGVWVGVTGDGRVADFAALPSSLPPGDYRLETAGDDRAVESAALGWAAGAYAFTRYRAAKRAPARLALASPNRIEHLSQAVYRVRDLVNTPTEDMGPEALAAAAEGIARAHEARCQVIVGDELLERDFPAIHAVGRGSHRAPRLIELTWGKPSDPAVVLVGKGVCFDTGGLDLKPPAGMRWMKKDMGGAAHALALAELVMAENLPVHLRVLVPAVENAIGPEAYRPGDVVPTRAGLTVEIDNTDAEGRMVLCDALAAASEASPALIVDFATLTGAARIALGPDVPALFANDDALAGELVAAGERTDDALWRMPLYQPYQAMLESSIADLCNSPASKHAGAVTAALYLQHFVDPDIPWAHLDIYAWNETDRPGRPAGGEAFGLRAAFHYLEQRFGQ